MGSSSNEELCLKWNDFESVLSHSFNTMRNELDFCDVKIACFDDKSNMKTIPAHKVVLSGNTYLDIDSVFVKHFACMYIFMGLFPRSLGTYISTIQVV